MTPAFISVSAAIGVASFRFRGGLGMIYDLLEELGDLCSHALGLLVPECNVALAL